MLLNVHSSAYWGRDTAGEGDVNSSSLASTRGHLNAGVILVVAA